MEEGFALEKEVGTGRAHADKLDEQLQIKACALLPVQKLNQHHNLNFCLIRALI